MNIVARRYDTGQPVAIHVTDGRITNHSDNCSENTGETALPWIAPGFVDLQVNGYGGQEFSSLDLTPESVAKIVRRHFDFGVACICPTLTTQSHEVFCHALKAIANACETWPDIDGAVGGIHLEGPFLSAQDGPRGAHPAEHCRPPDWESFQRWQDAAGRRIKLLTLSPEYQETPSFIENAVASGVTVGIGHLSATGEQIRAAVNAGARFSTHLGNGAHRTLPRHPNYIWDQLAEDRLFAGLICDGHHLPAEVLKTFIRAKSPKRCFLVSDVSGLAGLPCGRYQSSGCELEILPDGRLVIAGQQQLLAGASRPIGVGVCNAVKHGDLDLAVAIRLASSQPAALIGRASDWSDFTRADSVVFRISDDPNVGLDIIATFLRGELVYSGTSASGAVGIASPSK